MYPTILELGSLAIRSYGVALAAAVLLTVWLVERDARKRGVKSHAIFDLAVTILLASIVGAMVIQTTTTTLYALGVPAMAATAVKGVVVLLVVLLYSQQARDGLGRIVESVGALFAKKGSRS